MDKTKIIGEIREYQIQLIKTVKDLLGASVQLTTVENEYKRAEVEIIMSPAVVGLGTQAMREAQAKKIMLTDEKYKTINDRYIYAKRVFRENSILLDLQKEILSSTKAILYALNGHKPSSEDTEGVTPF